MAFKKTSRGEKIQLDIAQSVDLDIQRRGKVMREVCSCCSLNVLPGPAWVLLNVMQILFLTS